MSIHLGTFTVSAAAAADSPTSTPIPEEEEFYSSWSLFLVCLLLILSLWTSYYLQRKRIRAVHETVVSIVAGMVVGFIVRLAPGHLIREMLVSTILRITRVLSSRGMRLCLFDLKCQCRSRHAASGERDSICVYPRHARAAANVCSLVPDPSSVIDFQAHTLLQPSSSTHHPSFWLRAEAGVSIRCHGQWEKPHVIHRKVSSATLVQF